ncbi:helix-turn-helix transcriptional regulator [Kocuria nitroreducens]|uniref:helix-turn-helix transcriptional regulator n=1 Tax=Kocuria nitroreducens TaxID=3058914 RepID=UPI0036DB4D66
MTRGAHPDTTEASSAPRHHPEGPGPRRPSPLRRPPWTLLTNHGHVLLAVAGSPDARVSEIAARVGITVRATLAILKDLEAAGYLTRHRVGRRSHYTVDRHQHFRHPATADHEVDELLAIFSPTPAGPPHSGT